MLFIISSSSQRNIKELLSHENLNKYFDEILGPRASTSKTEKIQMILDEHDLEPKQCVLITDTLGDLKEAEEANINKIGVTWGFHKESTLEEGDPDIIVQDLNHLSDVVEEI